jgi:hypothetical protein
MGGSAAAKMGSPTDSATADGSLGTVDIEIDFTADS